MRGSLELSPSGCGDSVAGDRASGVDDQQLVVPTKASSWRAPQRLTIRLRESYASKPTPMVTLYFVKPDSPQEVVDQFDPLASTAERCDAPLMNDDHGEKVNPALDAALDAALVRQLAREWKAFNDNQLRGALRQPTLVLSDADARLGYWQRETRTLGISRRLCRTKAWGVVVEVLKHEMAHQYVHEVLGVLDESAHGQAFRDVCAARGIDAAAAGLPDDFSAETRATRGRLLERVAKLLALAESDNVHEARAAMAAAQKLMLEHNIEHAGDRRRYGFRHLGPLRGRTFEPECRIAALLAEHFFVEVIWVHSYDSVTAKTGRVIEICGADENLDMAEYVYGFLTQQQESLWRAHKRAHGIKSDRERMAFFAGVVVGFADTLAAKRKEHDAAGLVWLGDADLERFTRARHPYTRSKRNVAARGASRAHGVAAGRALVLHRPVRAHGGGGGLLGA